MSDDKPINIYASHLWELDDDYLRLFDYLGDVDQFYYVNVSDPEAAAADNDPLAAREVLREQIEKSEVVVILSQHHYNDPDLIELQMSTARRHGKPLLAIEPFGPDSVPEQVKEMSDQVVEWYARKIVDAIKALARGEDVQRFDTIDWPGDL